MDPMMTLMTGALMAKWMVIVLALFAGLVTNDIVHDWVNDHSQNPF